jgi:hypothetical protein
MNTLLTTGIDVSSLPPIDISSLTFVDVVFQATAGILYIISCITGFSYVETNIIVYYIIIPFSWMIMLDAIFKFHYLKIASFVGYIIFFFCIKRFSIFCVWAFQKSVILLNYPHLVKVDNLTLSHIPSSIVGPTYITNSVIVCVAIPLLIYVVLFVFLIKNKWFNNPLHQKPLKNF